ncbi:hypothetical protein Dthio_PD2688 [Desulfonatronospira thiodismutans ASO3-1]|uniref:Uncharacterized protein n=1 Tax=Desulfonatronospira thiodismutans ASO3-1 TaxID=555779 RepID=D6SKR4_9BACT|nr:hypothetical protein Dthio_PD2688 [Desulfonatronospira thiodismutans ASO3-1]RQD73697.1 MAG: hypothetical protein D5S03_12150 [Desulfonatronospira sp. MSAO_Bac3]
MKSCSISRKEVCNYLFSSDKWTEKGLKSMVDVYFLWTSQRTGSLLMNFYSYIYGKLNLPVGRRCRACRFPA